MALSRTITLLVALLALAQLGAPARASSRQLLKKKGSRKGSSQAAREAKQLADQVAQLAALVADGQAQHRKQEREQRKKQEALEAAERRREKDRKRNNGGGGGRNNNGGRNAKKDEDDDGSRGSNGGGRYNGNSDSWRSRGDAGPIWGEFSAARGGGGGGGKGKAYATYHYYAPAYGTSSLYCADEFNKFLPIKPSHKLLQYPWTAYCADGVFGPMSQDKCGKCLMVTIRATGQSVKTRVVDLCGHRTGVDMDPLAFNAIDGNGAGVRDGHMYVKLSWC